MACSQYQQINRTGFLEVGTLPVVRNNMYKRFQTKTAVWIHFVHGQAELHILIYPKDSVVTLGKIIIKIPHDGPVS